MLHMTTRGACVRLAADRSRPDRSTTAAVVMSGMTGASTSRRLGLGPGPVRIAHIITAVGGMGFGRPVVWRRLAWRPRYRLHQYQRCLCDRQTPMGSGRSPKTLTPAKLMMRAISGGFGRRRGLLPRRPWHGAGGPSAASGRGPSADETRLAANVAAREPPRPDRHPSDRNDRRECHAAQVPQADHRLAVVVGQASCWMKSGRLNSGPSSCTIHVASTTTATTGTARRAPRRPPTATPIPMRAAP